MLAGSTWPTTPPSPTGSGPSSCILGVPAVIPQTRRAFTASAWCLITRHRIRVCFSEFIITNRTGSLPLIFWAIPTPVGERVWIWLRPGLALADLQNRARPDRGRLLGRHRYRRIRLRHPTPHSCGWTSNGANAFTAPAVTPLLNLITPGTPPRDHEDMPVPTALDLPDVTTDRGHAPGQASHSHPCGQETVCTCPGPGLR